ncbi:MAG TPA: phage tail sheath subtilisin-like domain-containing protein [Longimicrobiales bacterium]
MPVTPTYPGVYIEEIPSGVRTITGVATSITAFLGRAARGPVNDPVRIQSYGDYERVFGGLWLDSTMSYAVRHYFMNGGADAIVVRLENGAAAATLTLPAGAGSLTLEAANPGDWGNHLRVFVDHETKDARSPTPDRDLFNLTVEEVDPATKQARATEKFLNVSRDAASPRYVVKVLEQESSLVRVKGAVPADRPDETPPDSPILSNGDGSDGSALTADQYRGSESERTGIYALEHVDLFNLMVIPPFDRETDVDAETYAKALEYCKRRRAVLLVDAPRTWNDPSDVTDAATGVDSLHLRDENAAIYFPRIRAADPLQENRLEEFAPTGAVAGVIARTDAQRGVWKAPAGLDATLVGVAGLTYNLTDKEQGLLNPLGVNALRNMPVVGNLVWGARTLEGADRLASEWKYLPVRRLALMIEESLYRGTQWAVFEPNDEPLWAQLRLNVGAFMNTLFRQGAFQGSSPREAYLVKCDRETTTQNDINLGIVNILVGFAPLKPAEFVMIKIQQLAGQVAA